MPNKEHLTRVLEQLLNLPEAKESLDYLHKGYGTATTQRAWLDIEKILKELKE